MRAVQELVADRIAHECACDRVNGKLSRLNSPGHASDPLLMAVGAKLGGCLIDRQGDTIVHRSSITRRKWDWRTAVTEGTLYAIIQPLVAAAAEAVAAHPNAPFSDIAGSMALCAGVASHYYRFIPGHRGPAYLGLFDSLVPAADDVLGAAQICCIGRCSRNVGELISYCGDATQIGRSRDSGL